MLKNEVNEVVRELEEDSYWDKEDHVAWLCKETIETGRSVLIFCGSKKVIPHALPRSQFCHLTI